MQSDARDINDLAESLAPSVSAPAPAGDRCARNVPEPVSPTVSSADELEKRVTDLKHESRCGRPGGGAALKSRAVSNGRDVAVAPCADGSAGRRLEPNTGTA